jgi:hypothetical protein
MYEFFVSYSRHDAEVARAVAETLATMGVPAWMAESEILVEGRKRLRDRETLRQILTEASTASRRCLFVLSHHALDSQWVMGVEIPSFLDREREGTRGTQVIWPVIVGPNADAVRRRWASALSGRVVLECRDVADMEGVVLELCRAAGVAVSESRASIRPFSTRTVVSRFGVATERRRFAFALSIGTEWIARPPMGRGMLLNLRNGETGLLVNLVVGAMPAAFLRQNGAEHVEDANYFGEPFVTRRMALLSQAGRTLGATGVPGMQKARSLLKILGLKLATAIAGRQEVLGSHVVNILGQPHFAYTYRMRPVLGPALTARKYSVVLAPPGAGATRHFEFLLTAGFAGTYANFLRRVPRAEAMIRSFRFVDESTDT